MGVQGNDLSPARAGLCALAIAGKDMDIRGWRCETLVAWSLSERRGDGRRETGEVRGETRGDVPVLAKRYEKREGHPP